MFDVDRTALKIDSNIVIVASELLEHSDVFPGVIPASRRRAFAALSRYTLPTAL
jgi:hypothetical protein